MTVLLCGALPAQARVLEMKIDSLKTGAGSMQDVTVTLHWPEGASVGTLQLRAALLDVPTLSYRVKNVDWQCQLLRAQDQGWRCAGLVRTQGSSAFPLVMNYSAAAILADLHMGKRRLVYSSETAAPNRARIKLEQIPISWLKAFLASLWAQGRWTQGKLSGQVDMYTPTAGPLQINSDLAADDLSLETPDGLLAAAGLKGRLQINYRATKTTQNVDTRFTVHGGEFLYDNLYVQFPSAPVALHVLAERNGNQAWRLPQLHWLDPGVFEAQGQATLDGQYSVSDLDLDLKFADLNLARHRYLSGFLAPAGFADLLLTGKLDANLQLRSGVLQNMRTHFNAMNAVDNKARFTFAGIDGDLRWTKDSREVSSQIGWQNGAIYGIGLGRSRFAFTSANGEVRLTQPVALDALSGTLHLEHLRWQAPKQANGAKFQFGLSMDKLDLASLSQRLGWPPFTGSLGGKIPSAHYENNVLTLDGGVQMNLFDGSLNITDLIMERPLGVAPTLSADVTINDINLEPMTEVFGFGSITGRLDGYIHQLRLVDWSPVAFDARLETDRAWKGKRRISQRAVKDISSIGGSGLAGGLQAQALKLFNDFGYEKIGIGCRLKDNICTMDGVGSAGDGYIIVAGAGLPRIQVIGFRRRVDWPTLVSRLKAATQGQAPIIQ